MMAKDKKKSKDTEGEVDTKGSKKSKDKAVEVDAQPEAKGKKSKKGDDKIVGSIQIETTPTLEAIKKITSVLGNDIPSLSVWFEDGSMRIGAVDDVLTLIVAVPESKGTGKFTTSADTLIAVIKKRKQLSCELKGSRLTFVNGTYNGHIITKPFNKVAIDPGAGDQDPIHIKRGSGVAEHFNAARGSLALNNPGVDTVPPFMNVKVMKREVICVSDTQWHGAVYRGALENKSAEYNFNIRLKVLADILKLTDKGDEYDMTIFANRVEVLTDRVTAVIRMDQVKARAVDDTIRMMTTLEENIKTKATIHSDQILDAVNAMMGIAEDGKNIEMTTTGSGVKLEYKTSYGELEETFDVKVKGPEMNLKLTPMILLDLADLFDTGELPMGISEIGEPGNLRRRLVFKNGLTTYMMATRS